VKKHKFINLFVSQNALINLLKKDVLLVSMILFLLTSFFSKFIPLFPWHMLKKTPIVLCLGSSCFARGNQEIITKIKKYIDRKNISDKVEFKGDHCFSLCSDGPNMYIGDKLFQKINIDNLTDILDNALSDIL
jgi:NADH:ubiquinone oxidoreductase subunit E